MMSMSGLVLGGGQGGNVPLSIAGGPALYLDASVPTTVSIDVGVDQWTDLSGNGNHAANATDAQQPAYTANVLEFDNNDDALIVPANASFSSMWAGGGYVIAVLRPDSDGPTATGGRVFSHDNSTYLRADNELGGVCRYRFDPDFSTTDGSFRTARVITLGAAGILEMSYDADNVANEPVWRHNGTSLANEVVATPVGSHADLSALDLYIGNRAAGSTNGWDGGVLAMAFYASIPTAAEQTSLRQFFSRKFGIALS